MHTIGGGGGRARRRLRDADIARISPRFGSSLRARPPSLLPITPWTCSSVRLRSAVANVGPSSGLAFSSPSGNVYGGQGKPGGRERSSRRPWTRSTA